MEDDIVISREVVENLRDNATCCIKFINKIQEVCKNFDYMNDMLETIKANAFEIEHTFDYYLENERNENMSNLKSKDKLVMSYKYLVDLFNDFQMDGVLTGGDDDNLMLKPKKVINDAIKDGDMQLVKEADVIRIKNRLITELSDAEIRFICVDILHFKEEIVKIRRYHNRPPRVKIWMKGKPNNPLVLIDPYDYGDDAVNIPLEIEEKHNYYRFCLLKGVCCILNDKISMNIPIPIKFLND